MPAGARADGPAPPRSRIDALVAKMAATAGATPPPPPTSDIVCDECPVVAAVERIRHAMVDPPRRVELSWRSLIGYRVPIPVMDAADEELDPYLDDRRTFLDHAAQDAVCERLPGMGMKSFQLLALFQHRSKRYNDGRDAILGHVRPLDHKLTRKPAGGTGKWFEDNLYAHLRALSLRFLTEEDIVEIHMAEGTALRSTPDVLFLDDVWINGRMVRWMDAKAYFGTQYGPVFGGAKKAAALWGPGALVFAKGYSRRLRVPDTLLLGPGDVPCVAPHERDPRSGPHHDVRAGTRRDDPRAYGPRHDVRADPRGHDLWADEPRRGC